MEEDKNTSVEMAEEHLAEEEVCRKWKKEASPIVAVQKWCQERFASRRSGRLHGNVVRSLAAHVPRSNGGKFAILRQHRRVGSDVRYRGAEGAEVGVVRDVSVTSQPLPFFPPSREDDERVKLTATYQNCSNSYSKTIPLFPSFDPGIQTP